MKIFKLEAIRGLTAIYVVIHHFILFTPIYNLVPSFIRLVFRFGREAVLVFFLLSGFVICIAVNKSTNKSFYNYFTKRFLRIYPILLATFLISFLVFIANGNSFSPEILKSLAANIIQIQRLKDEAGANIPTFLGNYPLWSLSYEWWFYMLFFLLYVLISKYRKRIVINDIYLVLILSTISWLLFIQYPCHLFLVLSFFLLWWSGYYCGEIYLKNGSFNFQNMMPVFISLFIICLIIGTPLFKSIFIEHKTISEVNNKYPLTVYFYYYAETLTFMLLGLLWWRVKLVGFNSIFSWFSKLAPISYALYVVHLPIIQLGIPFIKNIYLLLFIKMCLVLVISYFLEIKYQPWVVKKYKSFENKYLIVFKKV